MGIDIESFVHPDRISEGQLRLVCKLILNHKSATLTQLRVVIHDVTIAELICPICHNVVENPVQTPSEHLFCEDELLEWLVQSTICPVTNTPLDASTIKVTYI